KGSAPGVVMAAFGVLSLCLTALLVAIAATDNISGDAAKHCARDRAADAAMGGRVADQTAAHRAYRRSGIPAALAIRGLRGHRRRAKREQCQCKNLRISVCHLMLSPPATAPTPKLVHSCNGCRATKVSFRRPLR